MKKKLVILGVIFLILTLASIKIVEIVNYKEVYYFQVDEESKWIIDGGYIELSSFDNSLFVTNWFYQDGLVYNGDEILSFSEYSLRLYVRHLEDEGKIHEIWRSGVSSSPYEKQAFAKGYSIARSNGSISKFKAAEYDMSTIYLELKYSYEEVEYIDTVPIHLSLNKPKNNKLPSLFEKFDKERVVSHESNSDKDIFYLGMSQKELESIGHQLPNYNGEPGYVGNYKVQTFGRHSEVYIGIENNKVWEIIIFNTYSPDTNINFKSNKQDIISIYGPDYQEKIYEKNDFVMEYKVGELYLSFNYIDGDLRNWRISYKSAF